MISFDLPIESLASKCMKKYPEESVVVPLTEPSQNTLAPKSGVKLPFEDSSKTIPFTPFFC